MDWPCGEFKVRDLRLKVQKRELSLRRIIKSENHEATIREVTRQRLFAGRKIPFARKVFAVMLPT
jgi:hypothetical protein